MPWAAGVYTRGYPSWSNDAASNLPISATKFDTEDNDFAAGLNNCLTKDGTNTPNAAMTWGLSGGQVLALTRGNDGTIFSVARTGGSSNPALQFSVVDASGMFINTNIATGLTLQIAGTAAIAIASTRAVTVGPPSAGTTITLRTAASAGQVSGDFGTTAGTNNPRLIISHTESSGLTDVNFTGSAAFNGTISVGNAATIVLSQNRNVSINSPVSGVALTVNGQSAGTGVISSVGNSTGIPLLMMDLSSAPASLTACVIGVCTSAVTGNANGDLLIAPRTSTSAAIYFYTGSGTAVSRMNVGSNGTLNITQNTASTGLAITGPAATTLNAISLQQGVQTAWFIYQTPGDTAIRFFSGGDKLVVDASGNLTMGGSITDATGPVRDVVGNTVSTATYSFALTDRGKHVRATFSGAKTFTIPANGSVAFPVGSTITIVNDNTGSISIPITTDTLTWAPSGSTGTRTLGVAGVCTLLKVTATSWYITGNGLT